MSFLIMLYLLNLHLAWILDTPPVNSYVGPIKLKQITQTITRLHSINNNSRKTQDGEPAQQLKTSID